MDTNTIFVLLLPLLLLPLFYVLVIKKRDDKKPRSPPSPSRFLIIRKMFGSCLHHALWQVSKKHGPVMLLQVGSVPVLVITSAEMAREVLMTHDLAFCTRPSLEGFRKHLYNFKDVALAPYGEYWRELRKICVLELLSAKRVQALQFVIVQEVQNMIDSISARSSFVVNLNEKINFLVHTIILRITLGNSYKNKNSDKGGNISELLRGSLQLMGACTIVGLFPFLGWVIAHLTGLQQKLDTNFTKLDTLLQQAVDEHSDPEREISGYEDIVDVLLRLEKEQLGNYGLTKEHIKAVLMDMYLAGTDTTSILLVWAMAELSKNPRIMKKVQEEVRRCVGKKGKVDQGDLNQLHYLKMVVKETLRLHPPGVVLLPRECMSHCNIGGYDIYPKTWLLVNNFAIARDPLSWKNPDDFFPERFLDCSFDYKGRDFEFLPFGAGRRGCPGTMLGVAVIELALANLIYTFNWELPPGIAIEDIDMEENGVLNVEKKTKVMLVPIKYEWET